LGEEKELQKELQRSRLEVKGPAERYKSTTQSLPGGIRKAKKKNIVAYEAHSWIARREKTTNRRRKK